MRFPALARRDAVPGVRQGRRHCGRRSRGRSPAEETRQRFALPGVPEPDDCRLQRLSGGRPAQRNPRKDRVRHERCRDQGLHGCPLRRLRAVPAAAQGHPADSLGGAVPLAGSGRQRALRHPEATPAARRRTRTELGRTGAGRIPAANRPNQGNNMPGFFIVIGVLIALGLAFVLPALVRQRGEDDRNMRAQANVLIYRDQIKELDADLANGTLSAEQHAAGRRELEKRALEDTLAAVNEAAPSQARRGVWAPIVLTLLIPAVAVGMYLKLGAPQAIAPSDMAPQAAAAPAGAQAQGGSPHSTSFDAIQTKTKKHTTHHKNNPDDGAGWAMLARSYNVLGRFAEAADAYSQAEKQQTPEAQLMADHADAQAKTQGQKHDNKPQAKQQRTHKEEPANLKALALLGTAAFDRKDYKGAIGYWEKVVRTAPADSEFTQSLQASLDEARALAEGRTPPAALPSIMSATPEAVAPAAANGGQVSGQIKLAPALAAKVSPGILCSSSPELKTVRACRWPS